MKYHYTVIYSLKGIVISPAEGDKVLVDDASAGLRAILTPQPDAHVKEGDRSLAVAGLIMRGLFNADSISNELGLRIADSVDEIRSSRSKVYGQSAFLIIIGIGEVTSFNTGHEQDIEDFVVCFDGAEKDEIRNRFQHLFTAVLIAVARNAEGIIAITKVADSIVFFRPDGKPVYSYSISGGTATLTVARQLANDRMQSIAEQYRLLSMETALNRVQRLILSSFETVDDPLRSFLASWSAFEIFVNKVFGAYETSLFESMQNKGAPAVQSKYIERIRAVMKDKYRLADKFSAISLQLSSGTADVDLDTLLQVKKVRDELSHGESVDESRLPVQSIRDLASKYLHLHLSHVHRLEK